MKAIISIMASELFWSIFTPILVAITAGYFALNQVKTNIRLSESNKWVEDLRELLSGFITQLYELKVKLSDLNTNLKPFIAKNPDFNIETTRIKAEELMKPVQKESRILNKLKHKIMLYLSSDDEHKKLRKLVSKLYNTANIEVPDLPIADFNKIQDSLDTLSVELINESIKQFEIKKIINNC